MQLRESFPFRTYMGLAVLGVGFGLLGAVGGAAVASNATGVHAQAPVIDLAITTEPVALTTSSRVNTEAAEAPSDQVGFVIASGADRWLVLPIDATKIAHKDAPLIDNDGVQQVIEPLRARELTPEIRAWRDVKVSVAGTCTDTLRDFAVITQLSGDHGYSEESGDAWTTHSVQANGTAYVAAKLDHCEGTYARAASAPPIVAFTAVEDSAHIALAEKTLLDSAVAKEVRAAFATEQNTMVDSIKPDIDKLWKEAAQVHSIAMTDPRTHDTWIAVHVSAEFSCGGPDINFYGLYRVAGDGIIAMSEMKSDNVSAIEALVDLDGDGVPELLGNGWLQPTHAFYSAEMETLASYDIPFIGCPC